MKFSILSVLLLSFLMQSTNPLDIYRWENRLILLFAKDGSHAFLQRQIEALKNETEEMKDRDLLIFQIFEHSGVAPNDKKLNQEDIEMLRNKLEVEVSDFSLLLIGKDGGVKLRKHEFTSPKVIFDLIDSMPMRMYEMRRKN